MGWCGAREQQGEERAPQKSRTSLGQHPSQAFGRPCRVLLPVASQRIAAATRGAGRRHALLGNTSKPGAAIVLPIVLVNVTGLPVRPVHITVLYWSLQDRFYPVWYNTGT
jgi:hypothetical protein